MNLFPASPAGGMPSYLDEVRSPDKRLRFYHRAVADTAKPGGRSPTCISIDVGSAVGVDNGAYFEQTGNAFPGAVIFSTSGHQYPPHANPFFITKLRVVDSTDIRYFVGWTTLNHVAFNGNDTLTDDAVGFQFSTNRSDTNWQLITNDGGTQTTTDSGLAFSTSQIYIMEIEFSSLGTSVRFRISHENFDICMSDTVVTSNLPTASSDMSPLSGIQTLAAAGKTRRYYWEEVWY